MIKFQIALLDDNGSIISAEDAGYVGQDFAGTYACEVIKPFLKSCPWTGKEIVLLNPFQMLHNKELLRWHSFRLVWEALTFKLCFITNTGIDILFEGSLPEGWNEMSSEDMNWEIQQLVQV